MKKITLIALLLFGVFSFSQAQKGKEKDPPKTVKKSTGTNKDGTKDMRLKENKVKPVPPVVTPKPTPVLIKPKPMPPVKMVTPPTKAPKTADKVIGPDAKGRTIYEGPRGGRYYINKEGHKEYITKEKG